ncbi:MAG TPA: hypothetical protein VKC66_29875, partial [Xanthobacteraceae bacterium]|nr:hypothetical protein [Xanthobacteraceae bacterium]
MPIRALPNGRPIPPHSLVAIDRNQWSPSTGTGGRLQSKRLVVFNRKQLVAISRCAQARQGGKRAAIGSRVQIATLPQVCIAGHFYAHGMPICCVFFMRSAGMVIVAGC